MRRAEMAAHDVDWPHMAPRFSLMTAHLVSAPPLGCYAVKKRIAGAIVFLFLLSCPAVAQRFQTSGLTYATFAGASSDRPNTPVSTVDAPSTRRRVLFTILGGLAGSAVGGLLGYQVGNGSSVCSQTCVRQPNYVGMGAIVGFAAGALLGYGASRGE